MRLSTFPQKKWKRDTQVEQLAALLVSMAMLVPRCFSDILRGSLHGLSVCLLPPPPAAAAGSFLAT